jgi:hypothetical protein
MDMFRWEYGTWGSLLQVDHAIRLSADCFAFANGRTEEVEKYQELN